MWYLGVRTQYCVFGNLACVFSICIYYLVLGYILPIFGCIFVVYLLFGDGYLVFGNAYWAFRVVYCVVGRVCIWYLGMYIYLIFRMAYYLGVLYFVLAFELIWISQHGTTFIIGLV